MKYKVMTTCFGFRGRKWEAGEVVDINPSENPPKHFVSLASAPPEEVRIPHRTEPQEMPIGKNREVEGGLAHGLNLKLDRILTTDKVPNNVQQPVKLKRRGRPPKSVA